MRFWKLFFIVAALFNFLAGLPMILTPEAVLASVDMPVPADLLFHKVSGLLVIGFGIIYAFVAFDLARYKPLVWAGVAGKFGVVVLFGNAWMQGLMTFSAFSVVLGDLVFTVGFLVFLLSPSAKA